MIRDLLLRNSDFLIYGLGLLEYIFKSVNIF